MTRQNQKNSGSTDGTGGRGKAGRESRGNGAQEKGAPEVYAALDLGTNNCRLLIARPGNVRDANGRSFRVINTYSRIVRLGEGLDDAQVLSAAAMDRTIDALKVCAERLARFGVTRSRCVTTAACRKAANGSEFLGRIFDETGIKLEIISGEDEARLAIDGCAPLLDPRYSRGLVLDIGGGSTELVWVEIDGAELRVTGCASLPFGVVTFAEKYGGDRVPEDVYDRMVADAASALDGIREVRDRTRPRGAEAARSGEMWAELQGRMWDDVGVLRTEEGMTRALAHIREMRIEARDKLGHHGDGRFDMEMQDVFDLRASLLTAETVTMAALRRRESRGAHQREDLPSAEPALERNQVIRLGGDGNLLLDWAEVARADIALVPKEASA